MDASPPPPPLPSTDETDELQFATVEPVRPTGEPTMAPVRTCIGCRRPIESVYYALRDKIICPTCRAQVDAPLKGSRYTRWAKATFMGLGAGLIGTVIWFTIRRAANIEVGLIAVLVGYMVGKAVLKGSGGRGGRGYQVLAVVLTYCCIAGNYVPDIVEGVLRDYHQKHPAVVASGTAVERSADSTGAASPATPPADPSNSTPAAQPPKSILKLIGAVLLLIVILFGLALAAPFLAGASNILGIVIIGFALWQAWKLTRLRRLPITGPYRLGPAVDGVVV